MPIEFKHQQAFAEWHALNLDRLDPLWDTPEYDNGEVRLTIRSYAPSLVARIQRRSAVVAVEWDWEVYATLFVAELGISIGPRGGFINSLTDDPDQHEVSDRAQLWEASLFEPLHEHVVRVIDPSACLFLCGRAQLRWATLAFDPYAIPNEVEYTVFNRGRGL